ncbi:hypothetical protein N440_2650 [Stenotrophomonas sp. CC22-02]|nr:hypothetical protein N440_2650 [Stenotrophomonas sp. CC22-02]
MSFSLAGLRPAGPLFKPEPEPERESSAFLVRREAEGMGVQDTP